MYKKNDVIGIRIIDMIERWISQVQKKDVTGRWISYVQQSDVIGRWISQVQKSDVGMRRLISSIIWTGWREDEGGAGE